MTRWMPYADGMAEEPEGPYVLWEDHAAEVERLRVEVAELSDQKTNRHDEVMMWAGKAETAAERAMANNTELHTILQEIERRVTADRIEALEGCLRELRAALHPTTRYFDGDFIADLLPRVDALLTPPLTCKLCGGPLVDGFCERRCSLLADSSDGPVAESDDGYAILRGQEPDRDFPEEDENEVQS